MQYTSTRDGQQAVLSSKCLLQGISQDGGLFVPVDFPAVSLEEIAQMQKESYGERAYRILSKYLTDLPEDVLKACIEKAYTKGKFSTPKIAPVRNINDNESVLELWHGPTLAFKDMALQIMPHILVAAKAQEGEKHDILILVATSGDTGKAALEGYANVEGVKIIVFYPNDGVSHMQKLQMTTQEGNNVAVYAVNGNFDDAQTGVKRIFTDAAIINELLAQNVKLSSANSINWGRLVPQIVYYFSAYADLCNSNTIKLGDKINYVIPTGNFGNILAAYYAKQMGLPINKLICASNMNNVLTEFIQTGTYNANRTFYKTISPSMDILISSNLERLLFELYERDATKVNALMANLKEKGSYAIDSEMVSKLNRTFYGGYASEEQTFKTIKDIYDKYGYVMDTHTAVAQSVYDEYLSKTNDKTHTVVVSTASPYKFPSDVVQAIDKVKMPESEAMKVLMRMGCIMPEQLMGLQDKTIRFKEACNKEDMPKVVLSFIK